MTRAKFEEIFELSIEGKIGIWIEGTSESYINKSFFWPLSKNIFIVKESPIDSITGLTQNNPLKCLTYFSALKDIWNSITIYSNIRIQIDNH